MLLYMDIHIVIGFIYIEVSMDQFLTFDRDKLTIVLKVLVGSISCIQGIITKDFYITISICWVKSK